MPLTIQPIIDLATADLELQTSIYSRTNLLRQIATARAVVDQNQRIFEKKNSELKVLDSESQGVKKKYTRTGRSNRSP